MLTITAFPPGFVLRLGSIVAVRAVRLLENNSVATRDVWWKEVRSEVKSTVESMGYHAVVGYSETTSIANPVVVLSAIGTVALLNKSMLSESPSQSQHTGGLTGGRTEGLTGGVTSSGGLPGGLPGGRARAGSISEGSPLRVVSLDTVSSDGTQEGSTVEAVTVSLYEGTACEVLHVNEGQMAYASGPLTPCRVGVFACVCVVCMCFFVCVCVCLHV